MANQDNAKESVMPEQKNEKLYTAWEKRWENAQKKGRVSFLGKRMFKAKKKTLGKALEGLKVETVIEIGCGLGHTLEVFQEKGIPYRGIDISLNAVSFCQKKGFNAIQKNVEDVVDQYDLVSSDGMLEHFLDFEPCAKHLMRISKKYVLLIQPNHDSLTGKTFAYLAEIFRSHLNVYEYNYRIRDFIDVFERNDFKLFRNYSIFFNVFRLLLFKKKISK